MSVQNFVLAVVIAVSPAIAFGQTSSDSAHNHALSLYDAFGAPGEGLVKHFGFSLLVEYRGTTILFDAGSKAEVLRKNVESLAVDLSTVDFAVLSHNDADHFGGFSYFREMNPTAPIYVPAEFNLGALPSLDIRGPEPESWRKLPREQQYYGGDTARMAEKVEADGHLGVEHVIPIDEHSEIAPGITLVSTRSKFRGTFSAYPPNEDKPVLFGFRELSLSLSTDRGEVLIVGCSHASVEAIILSAREHISKPIDLVVGGYHLIPYDTSSIEGIVTRMRDEYGIKRVAPTHCTGHRAFAILRDAFSQDYEFLGLGTRVTFAP